MILRLLHVNPNLKGAGMQRSPLHVATACGDLIMMKELLKEGAALDACYEDGRTALHLAAQKDMVEAVQLLLHHNANPNAEDNHGHTPLWHFATWSGMAMHQRPSR